MTTSMSTAMRKTTTTGTKVINITNPINIKAARKSTDMRPNLPTSLQNALSDVATPRS